MRLGLSAGGALQLKAQPDGFVYDCHGRAFVRVAGTPLSERFASLYLSLMFGVRTNDWWRFLKRCYVDLERLEPGERDAYVAERRPRLKARDAVELALEAYPEARRFFSEAAGEEPPRLSDAALYQSNLELTSLEARSPGADSWRELLDARALAAGDLAILRPLLARLASGRCERAELARTAGERLLLSRLEELGMVEEAPEPLRPPPPGLYLTGHSSLLVRGHESGLLVDPQLTSPVGRGRDGSLGAARLSALVDGVALTHGHFDHYHLPTLMQLSDRPLRVPPVARASLVCEDMAQRLEALGCERVEAPVWGSRFELGDVTVHVLPFYGEQFLTSELFPDARNWGSCYVVEAPGGRALVAADAGFESGGSLHAAVAAWVDEHGPIDLVAAQALGLRTAFGVGDPDLQITALTCTSRAHQCIDLLRPERRVTLAPEDLPSLARLAGARRIVLHGEFAFERGAPAIHPQVVERTRRAFDEAAVPAEVLALRVGEGVAFGHWSIVSL